MFHVSAERAYPWGGTMLDVNNIIRFPLELCLRRATHIPDTHTSILYFEVYKKNTLKL